MATISIRIDDEFKMRLDRIAAQAGMSRSEIVREAITDALEEREDFCLVKKRLAEPFQSVPHEEVWKRIDTGN